MMQRMSPHPVYGLRSPRRDGGIPFDAGRRRFAEMFGSSVSRRIDPWLLSLLLITAGPFCAPSSEAAKIRLACVGDSITEGAGLSVSYPVRLGRLLGAEYNARNFGV